MKTKVFSFIVIFSCLLLLSTLALAQEYVTKEDTKSITTSGEAKIWIEPDRARVYLGVETFSLDVNIARQENAVKVKQALESIKALKIEGMLIKAPMYQVVLLKEPEYEATRNGRLPKMIGYKVIQDFTVLLENKDMQILSQDAAKIIDTALNNSVNDIQNVEFFKEDDSQDKRRALDLAVKDAMNNAKVIAESAGVAIESYMTINSSTQYWRPPVVQMRQGVYGDEMGKSLGMPTTLVAGKNAITSSVTLRAKIK